MKANQDKMFTYPTSVWMYKWGLIPFNVIMLFWLLFLITNMIGNPHYVFGFVLLFISVGGLVLFDQHAIKGFKVPRYIWISEEGIKGRPLFGDDVFYRWEEITTIIEYSWRNDIELVMHSNRKTLVIGKNLINFQELFDVIKSNAKNAEIISKVGW